MLRADDVSMESRGAPESRSEGELEEKSEVVPHPVALHENYDATGEFLRASVYILSLA